MASNTKAATCKIADLGLGVCREEATHRALTQSHTEGLPPSGIPLCAWHAELFGKDLRDGGWTVEPKP